MAASRPRTTATTPPPPADVNVPAEQAGRAARAAAGALYLVDAARLRGAPRSEDARAPATVRDATRAALARGLAGGKLLMASAAGVTSRRAGHARARRGARRSRGATMLAGGDGAPVRRSPASASASSIRASSRAPLSTSRASGLGVVRADSSVVVADSESGAIVRLRAPGRRLKPGPSIPVGSRARTARCSRSAASSTCRSSAASRSSTSPARPRRRSSGCPRRPSQVWISPAGMLFATLPASDGVAVRDLTKAAAGAVPISAVGKQPQGIAGTRHDGLRRERGRSARVSLLSATTGKARRRAPQGRGAARPRSCSRPSPRASRTRRIRSTWSSRSRSPAPVVTRDVVLERRAIAKGGARILVWKGGVKSRVRKSSAGGATL